MTYILCHRYILCLQTLEPKKAFIFIFTSFYLLTSSEPERQAQELGLDAARDAHLVFCNPDSAGSTYSPSLPRW